MEYETLVKEVPSETVDLIKVAIDIYTAMSLQEVKCKAINAVSTLDYTLDKVDKKIFSLFLASLIIDSDVKDIMNKNNITLTEALDFIGLSYDKLADLSDKKIKDCYDKEFKNIISSLIVPENNTKKMYPENIIVKLYNTSSTNNQVMNWFFRSLDKNTFLAMDHNTYQELVNLKKEKSIVKNTSKSNLVVAKEESVLKTCGKDLTKIAYLSDPAIERDKEIKNLIVALLTQDKSALVVGDAGVGKTAVVYGLAYRMKNLQVPKVLQRKRIIKINASSLVDGCSYIGMLEKRVNDLIKEVKKDPSIILFIDEMHTTMGAGAGSKSNMDVASILKENLEHNGIKLIGATTTDEYQTYIETNQAFKRRFEKIMIKEPSKEVTEKIVRSKLDELSLVTKVKVDFNLQELAKTVETIVEVSDKNHRVYDDNANNPDLALTILKKAFAFTLANDHDTIEASDVEEAIKSCERINESYREEAATKYGKEMTKLKNSPNKVKEKIINFPKSVN